MLKGSTSVSVLLFVREMKKQNKTPFVIILWDCYYGQEKRASASSCTSQKKGIFLSPQDPKRKSWWMGKIKMGIDCERQADKKKCVQFFHYSRAVSVLCLHT